MPATRQGSFRLTAFLSLAYGFAGFTLVVYHLYPDEAYQHDGLANWVLAPLGVFFGFFVSSWIHELAHFFAARFLGAYVRKVQIGSGVLLTTFHLLGTRCDVHESLRSGAVWYSLTSGKNARAKLVLITGAAPITSLALAGISIGLLVFIRPLIEPSPSFLYYAFPCIVGFTLPCLIVLPGMLLPFRYQYAGRTLETDAMKLLTIPRMTEDRIAQLVSSGQDALDIENEIDPATSSLEEALAMAVATPRDTRALFTAIAFLRAANDSRTFSYFRKLIKLPSTLLRRTDYIDQYVTYCLEQNAIRLSPQEMDALSRELLEATPNNISAMGTRGSVLIDIGQIEEGKAMLQEVLAKTEATIDKAYSHIFLALAAKAEGNLDLAREHAIKARQADAACPALKRIADLLP